MSQAVGKILVTGGAGFIGSHLVDRLLQDSTAEVVVLDNLSRGWAANIAHLRDKPRFTLVEGDIRNPAVLLNEFKGASLVYHLAAQSSAAGALSDQTYTFETNVLGTFNVLRAAVDCGVPRVLFTSCSAVYGESIALPVGEDSPLLAISSYGASKIAGEAYCRAFRRDYGLQTVILRLANVYGTRDRRSVIQIWSRAAWAGRPLEVYGGKQVMDIVWIGQVVEALVRAAALEIPLPPINVGTGTGTRIIDLASRIARLSDARPGIQLRPARAFDVTRFIANVERMRKILMIEPPLDPLANLTELVPLSQVTLK